MELERRFVSGDGFEPLANGEDEALREQQAVLEARADNIRTDYADCTIDGKTLKAALDRINDQIADIRRQRAELARAEATRESVREWVERVAEGPTDFDQMRSVIAGAIERITVRKTGKRGRRVEPHERIEVTWAEGRGFPDVVKTTTPEGDTVYFDPKAAMRRKAKHAS